MHSLLKAKLPYRFLHIWSPMPFVSISVILFFDCTFSPYLLLSGSLCSSVWSSAPAEGFAPESVSSGPPDAPEHNAAEMITVTSLLCLLLCHFYTTSNKSDGSFFCCFFLTFLANAQPCIGLNLAHPWFRCSVNSADPLLLELLPPLLLHCGSAELLSLPLLLQPPPALLHCAFVLQPSSALLLPDQLLPGRWRRQDPCIFGFEIGQNLLSREICHYIFHFLCASYELEGHEDRDPCHHEATAGGAWLTLSGRPTFADYSVLLSHSLKWLSSSHQTNQWTRDNSSTG